MTKIQKLQFLAGSKKRPSGAALIIALCFLVIICAVVLALYSGTRNDLVNSQVFANGQGTILLTDTAVNLVEGQITTASSQPGVAWASQPGMIHAYNTGNVVPLTTTGTHTAFKLYSSGTMVDFNWGAADQATETQNMEGWKASTDTTTSYNAGWCDLNAPAVVNRPDPTNPANTVATPVFPIVDPGAAMTSTSTYTSNVPNVQGFGFSSQVPGTNAGSSAIDPARRLAMPVEWIYVLKNGQLISPSSPTASSTATFTGSVVPTSSNPIIGRIAFWADDNTCKLNINTASEGTFWDMPRAVLPQEWYFGFNLPILGEFQAIGGHPATTSLDPVLGDLLPRPTLQDTSIDGNTGTITSTGSYTQLQSYYALNPRITDNAIAYNPFSTSASPINTTTSLGGTVSTLRTDSLVPTVVFKTDRLYATADELLFNPNRGLNPNWSPNTATTPTLTAAMLAQRDFFITAQSRAPETTLFGTPRISLWPIQSTLSTVSNGTYQSARDQLINFCATVGGYTYSFQRGQVSNVGGTALTVPAASLSVNSDWLNIPRNQSVFNYATSMMEATAPGFGTSLGTTKKWGSVGCERMMTMVMDFIRSGLSQVGSTAPTASSPNPNYWCYRDEVGSIRGAVIPLQVTTSSGTYNGMGRNWSVCSAAIQVTPTSRVANAAGPDGYLTTGIQAVLLLNLYNPMPTPQIVDPVFRVAVTNNTGLGVQVAGGTISGPGSFTIATGTVLVNDRIGGENVFFRNYAFPGFFGLLYQTGTNVNSLRTMIPGATGNGEASDENQNYPFLTGNVSIVQTGTATTTFSITGGTITIQILEGGGTAAAAHVVQTENIAFPLLSSLPLPQSVAINNPQTGTYTATDGGDPATQTFSTRNANPQNNVTWFMGGDIVREVQLDPKGPTKGDYRLLSMATIIPANWFTANANYTGTVTAFTLPDPNPTNPLAEVQDEVKSLLNRFAFDFQNLCNFNTFGPANGEDGELAGGRYGSVACAGITWGGPPAPYYVGDPQSAYENSNNYTVNPGGLLSNLKFQPDWSTPGGGSPNNFSNIQPIIPPLASGTAVTNASGVVNSADWSSGIAFDGDGAILSAPDTVAWEADQDKPNQALMYVGRADWAQTSQEAVTEPNRVVPSPILLGSLPTPSGTSTISGDGYGCDLQPWQSLLFCPNPLAGTSHPGFGTGGTGSVTVGYAAQPPFSKTPPDHLLCDLFWMPVVEPYAISDPLSTAGKVNLNYEMEPFTHITRRTALVGVLTPVEIGAICNTESYISKDNNNTNLGKLNGVTGTVTATRFSLNLDTPGTSASYTAPGGTPPSLYGGTGSATGCFTDFENRFASGDVFRSASEVCTIRLVPSQQNMGYFDSWWTGTGTLTSTGYQMTGLNLRESPYNQIYSRITTKSNTYTVHYWVQSLQQVPVAGRSWATWNENQDVKTGEYRGNTVIERYLDPNNPNIPDYTTVNFTGSYTPIDQYYSWRVVSQKQFAPGSN